jgi:hypothetical protein
MNAIDRAVIRQLMEALPLSGLHRVVDTFESDICRLTDALAAAGADADAPTWKRHCHGIAGVAGALGAAPLEYAARAAMEHTDITPADAVAEAAKIRALGKKAVGMLRAFLAEQERTG